MTGNDDGRMTRSDRDDLIGLARKRAKLAKDRAAEREKILIAETEDLMTAAFAAEDALWAEAVAIAEKAARAANERIAEACALLGIPPEHAPGLELRWRSRSSAFSDRERRAELRRLAHSRLTALTAAAKTRIDEQLLEVETALVAGGLASGQAREVLARLPTADELMPVLSLDDLGVKTWQPPEGAAAALLTPSTPADRRRRKMLRAIEQHPGASDREIGRLAGVDGKTVAAYRHAAAELPAPDAGFRTNTEEDL